jgi:hypothetical protein
MDASSRAQDLMRGWITAQQQLMTSWMDAMRTVSGGQSTGTWGDFVGAWQQSVTQGLDMQAEWVRNWAQGLTATEGTPEQMRAQIRAGQEMLENWNRAQRELWQNWFEALKNANAGADTGNMAQMGQNWQQAWTDSMQRLVDTQTAWARRWMPGIGSSQAET